jgi:hypothetical protein
MTTRSPINPISFSEYVSLRKLFDCVWDSKHCHWICTESAKYEEFMRQFKFFAAAIMEELDIEFSLSYPESTEVVVLNSSNFPR